MLLLLFLASNNSFSQNYAIPLGTDKYLTCDELETLIVKKCELKYGWDDYELKSSFLEKIKLYSRHTSNFALVKMKDNDSYYVYCNISNDNFELFRVFIETGHNSGKLFNEYISPNKCDCK